MWWIPLQVIFSCGRWVDLWGHKAYIREISIESKSSPFNSTVCEIIQKWKFNKLFIFKNIFYWSEADLHAVNLGCTAKWASYTYIYMYIYSFSHLFLISFLWETILWIEWRQVALRGIGVLIKSLTYILSLIICQKEKKIHKAPGIIPFLV